MTMQAYPIEKKAGEPVFEAASVSTEDLLPAYSATSPAYGAPTMDLHHVPSSDQERDFEAGLFDCCSYGHRTDFAMACCLPAVSYGVIASRLDHIRLKGFKHPTGGSVVNQQSAMYCGVGVLSSIAGLAPIGFVVSKAMSWKLRTDMRKELGLRGTHWRDGLTNFFCEPCMFVQEQKEMDRAERAIELGGDAQTPIITV